MPLSTKLAAAIKLNVFVCIVNRLDGWGRIYSGTSRRSPWKILLAMLFLLVCGFSVYPILAIAIAFGSRDLLMASVAHLLLMTGYLASIYKLSGNAKRYAWLFPLSCWMLMAIFCFALRMCYTGKLKWRDTTYGAELSSG